MPPGEVAVSCPGCNNAIRVPFSAVRRDNLYCPMCGKKVSLAGVQTDTGNGLQANARTKPKKSSRPYRR